MVKDRNLEIFIGWDGNGVESRWGFALTHWVFSWRMTKESLEGETSFSSGGFFLLRGDERVVL